MGAGIRNSRVSNISHGRIDGLCGVQVSLCVCECVCADEHTYMTVCVLTSLPLLLLLAVNKQVNTELRMHARGEVFIYDE